MTAAPTGDAEELFAQAPVAFGLFYPDGRILQVNPALAALSGLPPATYDGRHIGEILPLLATRVPATVRDVARTGCPLRLSNADVDDPGPPMWEAGYWPVRDGAGQVVAVGVMVLDVTARVAAEASTARLAALLRVTDAALSTLEPGALLDRLAERVAEVLGAADVRFRLYETAEPGPAPPARARGGRITAPLSADGQVIGELEVTGGAADGDLALVEVVADRAARGLANARRHDDERRLAALLRESLLPPELPELPGMTVHGRLWAARPDADAGGDFYDAIALGGRRAALVIGDVHGEGHAAIAVLLVARQVLRDALGAGVAPTQALQRLDRALRGRRRGDAFLTCAVAVLDCAGDGCLARIATGGGPAPVVARAGGHARPLELTGAPLGVRPDTPVAAAELRLAPGDTLVLHTDGLTEAAAPDRVLGPEDVAWMLADARGRSPEGIAEHLRRMAVPQRPLPIVDCAVLVVQADRRPTG